MVVSHQSRSGILFFFGDVILHSSRCFFFLVYFFVILLSGLFCCVLGTRYASASLALPWLLADAFGSLRLPVCDHIVLVSL